MDKLTNGSINDLREFIVNVIRPEYPLTAGNLELLCQEVQDLRAQVDRLNARSKKL